MWIWYVAANRLVLWLSENRMASAIKENSKGHHQAILSWFQKSSCIWAGHIYVQLRVTQKSPEQKNFICSFSEFRQSVINGFMIDHDWVPLWISCLESRHWLYHSWKTLAGLVHLFRTQAALRRGHRDPANTHRHPLAQKTTRNISKLMQFAKYFDPSTSQWPQELVNMDHWVPVLNKQYLAWVRIEADAT